MARKTNAQILEEYHYLKKEYPLLEEAYRKESFKNREMEKALKEGLRENKRLEEKYTTAAKQGAEDYLKGLELEKENYYLREKLNLTATEASQLKLWSGGKATIIPFKRVSHG